MEKDNKQEKIKDGFSNAWKKTTDFGQKFAEGTKKFIDQTKENIHEQQAKKYFAVTAKQFKSKNFQLPNIIRIEDDFSNRNFIDDPDAIGWLEVHKEVQIFHMYFAFVNKCGIDFVPVAQKDNVYYQDHFDFRKYIDTSCVFGRATEEKLAELNNIAYCLGAKSCSIEIVDAETDSVLRDIQLQVKKNSPLSSGSVNTHSNKQQGRNISYFEGHDNPVVPALKWFAHDNNIKGLIEMRCNKAIKSNVLELKGASSATMSKKIACAIDDVLKIKGNISMERQAIKEHSNKLLFEIEF